MILYRTSDRRIEHPDISFSRAYLIEREEAIKRLRKKKPNWQICFCNQTLIDSHLHFVESIELKNDAS